MAEPPPTIVAAKQSFLDTQTRILSRPLAPSRQWRQRNAEAAAAAAANRDRGDATGGQSLIPLSERAVDDAVARVNQALESRAARSHAPQASRHVAEQVERLYFWDGSLPPDPSAALGDGGAALILGTDFATDASIAALPQAWPGAREASKHNAEARRFRELAAHLGELSARRAAAQRRVARLRGLAQLLEPFEGSKSMQNGDGAGVAAAKAVAGNADVHMDELEGRAGMQAHLITRDGDAERELERMRVLLARVGDRVARLKKPGQGGKRKSGKGKRPAAGADVEDQHQHRGNSTLEQREKDKLGGLLGDF